MIEKRLNIQYGDSQQAAIEEAIKSPLFILTGGPGTGKTTVINGIVSLFAELNGLSLDLKDYTQEMFPILLAAPNWASSETYERNDRFTCKYHPPFVRLDRS